MLYAAYNSFIFLLTHMKDFVMQMYVRALIVMLVMLGFVTVDCAYGAAGQFDADSDAAMYRLAWGRVVDGALESDESEIVCYWQDAQDRLKAACIGDGDDVDQAGDALEEGARIDVIDEAGNTPLHLAAAHGNVGIVYLLLEICDVTDEIENNQGYTALDLAFKKWGHRDACRYVALEALVHVYIDRKEARRANAEMVSHLFGE